jgi:hypothetical protein
MIIEDPKKKKELDKVPDVDENGDPIYKIDNSSETEHSLTTEDDTDVGDDSEFKDTLQDLKDSSSQE